MEPGSADQGHARRTGPAMSQMSVGTGKTDLRIFRESRRLGAAKQARPLGNSWMWTRDNGCCGLTSHGITELQGDIGV
jgi:hypothetical protein